MNDRRLVRERMREAEYSRMRLDKREFIQMRDGQFFEMRGGTAYPVRDNETLQKLKEYTNEYFQLNAFEIRCVIRDCIVELERKIQFIKHADIRKLPRDMELELSSCIDKLCELKDLQDQIENKEVIYDFIKKRRKN